MAINSTISCAKRTCMDNLLRAFVDIVAFAMVRWFLSCHVDLNVSDYNILMLPIKILTVFLSMWILSKSSHICNYCVYCIVHEHVRHQITVRPTAKHSTPFTFYQNIWFVGSIQHTDITLTHFSVFITTWYITFYIFLLAAFMKCSNAQATIPDRSSPALSRTALLDLKPNRKYQYWFDHNDQ